MFFKSHGGMVRSARELFAIEKLAHQNMCIQKIAETVGVPLRTTWEWLHSRCVRSARSVAQRLATKRCGGWIVSLVFASSSHISRIARCVSRIASVMNSGTSSCTFACCCHRCRHSMLHSRQCGSIWHRAHPPQDEYMAAERWPKQVICGKLCAFHHYMLVFRLSTGQEFSK